MINGIKPMIVKEINCHQPDLPTSCSLLAPTANEGKRVTIVTNALIYKVPSGIFVKNPYIN